MPESAGQINVVVSEKYWEKQMTLIGCRFNIRIGYCQLGQKKQMITCRHGAALYAALWCIENVYLKRIRLYLKMADL